MGSLVGGIMSYYGAMDAANMNIDYQKKVNAQNVLLHNQDKDFNASESSKARDFLASQSDTALNFNANQAQLNRDFQASEAEKARQFELQMPFQQIKQSAAAYNDLGISPAAMLGGLGSMSSAPFASGDSAQISSTGTAEASAPGAPTLRAPQVPNAMASLVDAFSSLETATSRAQNTRLDSKMKETELKYINREKELGLKLRLAEIDKTLSQKGVNEETRKKLVVEKDELQFQLDLHKELRNDLKQQTILETSEKQERVKGLVFDNVEKRIQTEHLEQRIAKEFNLMDSQAASCVMSAKAAMQSSLVAKYNARTGRMQFRFDKQKYKEVYKANVESQTEKMKSSAELDQRNTDAVTEREIIDVGTTLFHELNENYRESMKAAAGIIDFF